MRKMPSMERLMMLYKFSESVERLPNGNTLRVAKSGSLTVALGFASLYWIVVVFSVAYLELQVTMVTLSFSIPPLVFGFFSITQTRETLTTAKHDD